ncbi:MAG: hypothetical protein HKP38_02345 [Croceitalea sp.]|nr:hypothetical protein [Croceitalea sp.]MBT8238925.1 hypothetical protein [Croceitalea sp.]NNC33423.1 hypothetical protein [Croceitalea sp.]NNL08039.1 hypothetical protein [Croceitalea sp.]NNM19323.1 hypothetical protein [Croceitalea sp.]
MKAVLTLITVIFFSTVAMAQNNEELKVETITMSVELNIEVKVEKDVKNDNQVARLYMFKNSRVKKALSFKTKKDNAKMA